MDELLPIFLALISGIGLGVFYFGGLWWTVQRIPSARHPALLSLGSFFARLAAVLVGFYFLTDGHWTRLLIGMAGFLTARIILVRRWGPGQKCLRSRP
jgi:F1F0 ATPase subunit 2